MIDLYTWPTPNGHKVHIMLEEVGLPYNIIAIDIGAGDQFDPEFLKISPNNKMPAMVDREGPDGESYALFESGAILLYLAEKTGRFMPADMVARYRVVQWLMFQMGTVGPMLGQAHHFRNYAPEPLDYAIDRYTNEARRIYNIIDKRLGESAYLAGEDYTIADMATFPWVRIWPRQGIEGESLPNFQRWLGEIDARPAVQRGLKVLEEQRRKPEEMSEQAKEILFGAKQYAVR